MKKTCLLFLILCLVLLPLMAACGGNGNGGENGTSAGTGDSGNGSGEATKSGNDYLDSLPERNYNLSEYRVLCTTQTLPFYKVGEEDKDLVSESVFRRNAATEEKYGVVLSYTALDGNATGKDAFATAIRTSVTLDVGYDLIVGQQYYCLPVATEGNLQDLKKSPFLHWDEKWYSPKINDNAIVNGRMYGASGSYIMSQISYAMATFYNKELWQAENHGVDLYDLVDNMQWTYERLFEYTANRFNDVDDDGKKSDADSFGYVYNGHGIAASVAASETPITTRNPDGTMTILNYYNDHLLSVFEKYSQFYNESLGTFKRNDDFGPAILLGNGNTLFACAQLGVMHDCTELRNSTFHYGVLPMPLFDETQKEYYTYTMRWELFYVPSNADLERSTIVLEYLNYSTEQYIIPAYWEEALALRAADTEQDSRMMYKVRDALWYDFVTFYNHEIPMRDAVASQINSGSTRLSSWWRGNKDALEKSLQRVLETYGSDLAG